MSEGAFEAKHYAMRKSKDGTIISFVVHPSDTTPELTALPIGARVMIGWSEIGDDERAKIGGGGARTSAIEAGAVITSETAPTAAPGPQASDSERSSKPKRTLTLAEECAIACEDKRFQAWLANGGWISVKDADTAAEAVRAALGIKSRADLNPTSPFFSAHAANRWHEIHQAWRNSEAEKNYGVQSRPFQRKERT